MSPAVPNPLTYISASASAAGLVPCRRARGHPPHGVEVDPTSTSQVRSRQPPNREPRSHSGFTHPLMNHPVLATLLSYPDVHMVFRADTLAYIYTGAFISLSARLSVLAPPGTLRKDCYVIESRTRSWGSLRRCQAPQGVCARSMHHPSCMIQWLPSHCVPWAWA
jgi:hypothetical protein